MVLDVWKIHKFYVLIRPYFPKGEGDSGGRWHSSSVSESVVPKVSLWLTARLYLYSGHRPLSVCVVVRRSLSETTATHKFDFRCPTLPDRRFHTPLSRGPSPLSFTLPDSTLVVHASGLRPRRVRRTSFSHLGRTDSRCTLHEPPSYAPRSLPLLVGRVPQT